MVPQAGGHGNRSLGRLRDEGAEMSDDIKIELRRTWSAPRLAGPREGVIAAGLADVTVMLDTARVGAGMRSWISPVVLVAKLSKRRSELAQRGGVATDIRQPC